MTKTNSVTHSFVSTAEVLLSNRCKINEPVFYEYCMNIIDNKLIRLAIHVYRSKCDWISAHPCELKPHNINPFLSLVARQN